MSQLSITTINIKSHNVRYRGSYIIQSWRRLNAPHGDDTETARHTRVLNHRHPRRRHTLTVTPLTWDTQHQHVCITTRVRRPTQTATINCKI